MKHYSLPTVRALIALGRGDGKQALVLLEAASAYEFGCPQSFANTEPAFRTGELPQVEATETQANDKDAVSGQFPGRRQAPKDVELGAHQS